MPSFLIVVASAAPAEVRIAGVPAAARAIQAIGTLPGAAARCAIVASPGWTPDRALVDECRRLAPRVLLTPLARAVGDHDLVVSGEAFVAALAPWADGWSSPVAAALSGARLVPPVLVERTAAEERALLRLLHRAGDRIVAATGKDGDGIVSRHLNRPISRAISRRLLAVPGLTPGHASAGTAILGLLMAVALFLFDEAGLVAGALLFQAASIFDGVDGEMARATFRTSDAGAAMDSVIDACTNIGFFTGVAFNIGMNGDLTGAGAGALTLVTLAVGLTLIGRRATARGEPVNFDGIKHRLRAAGRGSMAVEWLIRLTMRDFLALACALLVLAGLTHAMMVASAVIALAWFAVTLAMLSRGAPARRTDPVGAPARSAAAR